MILFDFMNDEGKHEARMIQRQNLFDSLLKHYADIYDYANSIRIMMGWLPSLKAVLMVNKADEGYSATVIFSENSSEKIVMKVHTLLRQAFIDAVPDSITVDGIPVSNIQEYIATEDEERIQENEI